MPIDPRALEIIAFAQPVRGKAVQHHYKMQFYAVHRDAVRAEEARDQGGWIVQKIVHIGWHQFLQTEQFMFRRGLRNAALITGEEHKRARATLRESLFAGGFEAAGIFVWRDVAHVAHFRKQP